MMKVARPDEKDLEAALQLLGLLDTVGKGYYPSDPEGEEDAPMRFDEDDPAHLMRLWERLKACFDQAPGFQGRVIFGAITLMDPRNRIIDTQADVIQLHPSLHRVE